jgi:anti-sigma B factor antagonist
VALLITATTDQGVTVLQCSGRVVLGESAGLRDAIRDALSRGETHIVLDLTGVNYIDSSGIGELVSGYTVTRNSGGNLLLAGLQKRVRDLLQITKLYTVFDVFENVSAAVESARTGPPAKDKP